jgi:crossover junction endodeoxyribonuclease RuvC
MVVLGIDPGTANTGYGVVARHGGVIETRAGADPALRLAEIHARVGALLDEHRPAALAVEDLYFGANARSAFAVGQARGVVVLAAGQRGLPCFSYTPQQVKGAVCGSGRASKEQVQRMVQALLSLDGLPRPDHAADALAVAICHANGARLRAAVERGRSEVVA